MKISELPKVALNDEETLEFISIKSQEAKTDLLRILNDMERALQVARTRGAITTVYLHALKQGDLIFNDIGVHDKTRAMRLISALVAKKTRDLVCN